MSDKYNPTKIEPKWQEAWAKDSPTKAVDFSDKPKKYILAELPYPSGEGLHVGHLMRYTMPDVYSRKLRMNGYNVLYPMGWDAFGLPAENYAVKTGVRPEVTTKKAIANFKRQLQAMGYGFDWDREVATTDPEYFKWTQWIFLKLWEEGLAELKEEPVWWCEDLKIVLANEEVIKNAKGELVSERGEKPVERRMLRQWVLKMPQYADKLIAGLDTVDFPDSIKNAQINWIGRSEGAVVDFAVKSAEGDDLGVVKAFTTAHDTIYGATFLVVAPEHDLIASNTFRFKNQEDVMNYVEQSAQKSDVERQADREKSGVMLEGVVAVNPANGEEIPIFTADYVLVSYGTGAIMAVPGHDERDGDFAKKYNLPIKYVTQEGEFISFSEVIKKSPAKYILANSAEFNGMDFAEARPAILDKLQKQGVAEAKVQYKLRDWLFSRQRYWGEPIPLIHKQDGSIEAIAKTDDPKSVEENLPLLLPEVPDYTPSSDATSPLAKNADWVNTVGSDGKPAKRETNTMPNWAGSCWYYMRYIDPKNDKEFADMDKLKYWLPVDKYFGGSEHTTLHLLYSRFWHQFLFDQGLVPTAEPYAWRMNGGLLMGTDGQKMSKSVGNILNPDEKVKLYGADAVRLYINFMGPFDQNAIWLEGGAKACRRLLDDVWSLRDKVSDAGSTPELETAYHKMVKRVGEMVDDLKTNTAVSEFMIFVNKAKQEAAINQTIWEGFLRAFAPFAVFITEELWSQLGHTESIHLQSWPEYDESKTVDESITIAVQVNGKMRDTITINKDASQQDALEAAKQSEKVSKSIGEQQIVKEIYVPGKIVNIVVE